MVYNTGYFRYTINMKIEKINENEIQAAVTSEDLTRRQIQLNEFAYGTDASHSLFNELLRIASYKLGFQTDDSPIVVEAIPTEDSLFLIVKKIQYPDELDTRFARFSDAPGDEFLEYLDEDIMPSDFMLHGTAKRATDILDEEESELEDDLDEDPENDDIVEEVMAEMDAEGLDDMSSLVSKILEIEERKSREKAAVGGEITKKRRSNRFSRIFCMKNLDEAIEASRIVGSIYKGDNSLYRTSRGYELLVNIGNHTTAEFNRIVNILCEYGTLIDFSNGTESYFGEHAKCLVSGMALQALSKI